MLRSIENLYQFYLNAQPSKNLLSWDSIYNLYTVHTSLRWEQMADTFMKDKD